MTQVRPFSVDDDGTLRLASRTIPVPRSISPAAQAFLAAVPRMDLPTEPEPDDMAGWRRLSREIDAHPMMMVSDEMIQDVAANVETQIIGNATVHISRPKKVTPQTHKRIYVDMHGGAFISGGGRLSLLRSARSAVQFDCICYGVDYRLLPEHPFPAGFDDCVNVYKAALSAHDGMTPIVGGVSAGGNLAAALALKVRDEGIQQPAAVILLSPALDFTQAGDTFETNKYIDVVLRESTGAYRGLYAREHDIADPYVSPLLGDFSKGFPPTFIQSGTRDLFLSNATILQRLLRKADVPVNLQLWEAMPHGGFGIAPEMDEVIAEVRRFMDQYWTS